MIYEKITSTINDTLGGDFLIEYANNYDLDWSKILPEEQENIKYGVVRVESGTTSQLSNKVIKTEQLCLTIAVPEDRAIFNQAINTIRGMMISLNASAISDAEDSLTALMYFGEYQDAQSQTVNGQIWWICNVRFLVNFYDSFVDSGEMALTIDGVAVSGLIDIDYTLDKTLDGFVLNLTPIQKNAVNGVRKILTVNLAYIKNDTMFHTSDGKGILDKEEDITKTYSVAYNNGIITRSNTMILSNLHERIVVGDIVKATLTFTMGG